MRLLVISNRLPITIVEKDGELKFNKSAGGLVSGLSSYLTSFGDSSLPQAKYIWTGWPGVEIDKKKRKNLKSKLLNEIQAYPVFISEKIMDKFYLGFCNKVIWPLFHYFPSYAVYDEDYWTHYKLVNETFCNTIMEIAKPGDIIWIHDYHLMLLPKLLREKMPNLQIGFFLHIPFPTFEIFRLLPGKWRSEILQGLLGSNLLGFHTYNDTQYFLRCVLCILGYEHNMGQILLDKRIIKADTFPISIDFQKFYNAANSPEVVTTRKEFLKPLSNSKVILSIDRLDYTKGIINRLRGYETFLKKNPQWHKKVTLVLIVVPSRIGVEQYRHIKVQIDGLVGKINGRFGSVNWTPIIYQYKSLPFNALTALYSVSDIALVTPLRDGMNLIAKEYIATKHDKTGVLILSEMAGASKELGEAIIINPNDMEEIADAIKKALEMPKKEQIKRNTAMQIRLKNYDVKRWADEFIKELLSVKEDQKRINAKLLNYSTRKKLVKDFKKAKKRLIFLDYDGTLVPFAGTPQMAKPTKELLKILKHLSESPQNEVVLISGRTRDILEKWFGKININLVAEHGVWIKRKNKDWHIIKPLPNDWKSRIIPVLNLYVDRLPYSFVEEKEFSVVWHYRKADPELASIRAKELTDYLVNFTANIDIQILQGSKVIEIRNAGVNKGTAGLYWLSKSDFDSIIAIGDDWTDEDLFKVLPETAYSIKVGMTQSYARFNLSNYSEVLELIKEISKK
ncbi:MAG: bifunctional alpha,alpha-trehalose-phosphate synthase (UDP-forming)/trehalose-phosphatase [bacterium]|nr:bifunctional alpha,alpha-trehalose-phosphate synthase (UDP-forming)/trehalose-phosphatase [bacterium]